MLTPGKIFTLHTLREKGIRYNPTYLRKLWKRGRFPKPFYLTERRPAWTEQQLDEWIAERVAERDAELRVQICPAQCEWPKPDVTFSIVGDKPIAKGMHWQRLHDAVIEARARVSKAYEQMDDIDGNATLSRDDKYRQRSKAADEAIADFEASKTLARAREAVRYDGSPATIKALGQAEAGWKKPKLRHN